MKDRLTKAWDLLISQPRQLLLATVAVLVIVSAGAAQQWIFPAYDRWTALREEVRQMHMQQELFSRNLALRDQVDRQLAELGEAAGADPSQQKALSQFMVDLETAASGNSLTMVNAKPEPVSLESACHLYRVRLTVSGSPANVVQFVHQLTDGQSVVGVQALILRATQSGDGVEAILTLQMARLAPADQAGKPREAGRG